MSAFGSMTSQLTDCCCGVSTSKCTYSGWTGLAKLNTSWCFIAELASEVFGSSGTVCCVIGGPGRSLSKDTSGEGIAFGSKNVIRASSPVFCVNSCCSSGLVCKSGKTGKGAAN